MYFLGVSTSIDFVDKHNEEIHVTRQENALSVQFCYIFTLIFFNDLQEYTS